MPDLDFVDCPEASASADKSPAALPSLARWSAPEAFGLLFRYHPGSHARPGYEADSCAVAWLERLVGSLAPGGPFDELIVADEDGTVLLATAKSGMRVANIASLFTEASLGAAPESETGPPPAASQSLAKPADKHGDSGSPPPQPSRHSAFLERAAASNVFPVTVAGSAYQAFLMPVPLRLARSDLAAGASGRTRLVVCGLIAQGNYRTAIAAVPGQMIVGTALLALVIVFGTWPILRFTQMRATETIHRRTGIRYALMTVWAMTFLVMLVIHVAYFLLDTQTDPRLDQLSKAVTANFQTEVQRSLTMLDAVEHSRDFQNAPASRVDPDTTCSSQSPPRDPDFKHSWLGDALTLNLPFTEYPYFDHLFWADRAGYQEIKWSTRKTPTPDKNECNYPFFQAALQRQLWRFDPPDASWPQFRVDPLRSPNTGRYIAVIAKAVQEPQPGLLHQGLGVAAVVSPMMSLVDPVLPPEYGFAVIDPSGLVLFHSQSDKNGNENLFHASRDDHALLALVSSRERGYVYLYYQDVRYRALVTPMSAVLHCPWTLVTFRDLTPTRSQHVERMTLFACLSILYLTPVTIVGLLIRLPHYPFRWLWPLRARAGRYRHLSLVLALVMYAYYRLTFVISKPSIIVAAVLVPAAAVSLATLYARARNRWILVGVLAAWAAIVLFYVTGEKGVSDWQALALLSFMCGAAISLCVRSVTLGLTFRWIRPSAKGAPRRRVSPVASWIARVLDVNASYSLVVLGLLLILGVIPCIGFFRIAYDYCEDEFTRRAIVSTAAALEQRACRVSAQYDAVRFSSLTADRASAADLKLERTARWLFLRRRLEQETLDRYDTVFEDRQSGVRHARNAPGTGPSDAVSASSATPDFLTRTLDSITARLPPWYVPVEQPAGDSSGCLFATWTPRQEGLNRLRLALNQADSPELAAFTQYFAHDTSHISQDLFASLDYLRPVPFAALPIVAVSFAVFFLLRGTIRRLYLTDLRRDKPWPEVQLATNLPPGNLILLGLPFSGKTQAFSGRTDVHPIDLAAILRSGLVNIWPCPKPIVVLDHFAFGCNDPAINRQKLQIVEQLVYHKEPKTIIILTTIDPLYYLEEGTGLAAQPSLDTLAPGDEMDRWTKALMSFTTMRSLGGPSQTSPEYYRILWSTCTKRERVALYQLAKEGWANCRNQSALRHLLRRGLIETAPEFRISDPDFREFILASVSPEDQRNLEGRDQISSWDGLKAALVVCVVSGIGVIAVLYGQQTIGYIVAGIGALTPVFKTIADLRGKRDPGATET
ncbi:MAG: hypothetical protein ABSF98_28205 [Bryobacteraceae bacterium]